MGISRQQASLLNSEDIDPSLVENNSCYLARVIDAFPERNLIDVMLLDGGGYIRDVQVLSSSATSKSGLIDLPKISFHPEDAFFTPNTSNQDAIDAGQAIPEPGIRSRVSTTFKEVDKGFNSYALIMFMSGSINSPVCVGFLHPETSEMKFFKQHKIDRHFSDIYSLIDQDGNYEHVFPDGTYIRIGDGTTRTDLVNADVNEKWTTKADDPATQDPARTVHIQHKTGTSVTINPDGSVTINVAGDHDITVTGNKTETVNGTNTQTNTGDHTITNLANKTETTTGNDTETVNGNKTETVLGNSTETITGNKEIQALLIDLQATSINLAVTNLLLTMQSGTITAIDFNMTLANLIVVGTTSISLTAPLVNLGPAPVFGVLPGETWFTWALTHTHPAFDTPPDQVPPAPSTTVRVSL